MDVEDIRRCYSLFVDIKRSTQFLMEYQKEFLFSEVDSSGNKKTQDEMDCS